METTLPRELAIAKILEKPLILGASVSKDQCALSPGKKLALRLHPGSEVRVFAKGGTPAFELLEGAPAKIWAGRTCVVALDLFFWDSAYRNAEASLRILQNLEQKIDSLGLPLLLGDVPELLPGFQPACAALNQAIHHLGKVNPLVTVLPLGKLLLRIRAQGFLEFRGRRFALRDLVPDGLHLSDLASEYLSDLLEEALAQSLRRAPNGSLQRDAADAYG